LLSQYEVKRLSPNQIRPRGHIARVPCNVSREEFVERFVRTMTPVVLVGCDYAWLENGRDLSVEAVAKVKATHTHKRHSSLKLTFIHSFLSLQVLSRQ